MTSQQLTVTLFVDTRANTILEFHVTTTRKHDSKIVLSLIKRNTGEVAILLGDKSYDDQKVRALAREENLRPLIKHRESRHFTRRGMSARTAEFFNRLLIN